MGLDGDNMINDEYIVNFLSKYDYDVRKSGNARWIDQKCTPDVVNVIAECIINYSYKKKNTYKKMFSLLFLFHDI